MRCAADDFDSQRNSGGDNMIDTIRQWLWGVITASICLAVLENIVPKGAIRGIAKTSGGLVILLVLLQPLGDIDFTGWDWKISDYQLEIDAKIEDYQEDYRQQMESIIADQLRAYISEKTEQMGTDRRVKVEIETIQNVPEVMAVRLSGQRDEALAVWMEEELGIDQSKQHWEDQT